MIRKFKYILIPFLIAGFNILAFAQQEPAITQYMFNHLAINPAYAGNHAQLSATLYHRDQWVNFPGAPNTQSFSAHSGFYKSRVGVGLMVTRDEIGIHKEYSVYGSYSYKIKMDKGILSFGLQAGFNQLNSDFDKLNIRTTTDPFLTGNRSKFNPNFGVGVYYHTDDMFLSVSVPYILNNDIVDSNDLGSALSSLAQEKRSYYIMGGKTFQPNRNLLIKPSLLIHLQDGAPLTYNLNLSFVLKELVSLGMSYRHQDALVYLIQFKINENFALGYAYDMTLTDISQFSRGSHELMLNYRIKLGRIHKGIECPSYFL